MTTYNSYAEAKIANPSEDIYATKISMGGRVEVFGVYVIIANITSNYYICEPSKYCMTVEKFLADGHKFVEGDVIYSRPLSKVIPVLSNGEFGVSYPVDGANNPMSSDDNRFILRAAALGDRLTDDGEGKAITAKLSEESDYDKGMREAMKKIAVSCGKKFAVDIGYEELPDLVESLVNPKKEKPKRVRVGYVKCEYGDKVSNIVMDFENDAPLYKMVNDEYWTIDELDDLFQLILDDCDIYRKVETEIDERQEFIDECMEHGGLRARDGAREVYGNIFDSGKFKLVNAD